VSWTPASQRSLPQPPAPDQPPVALRSVLPPLGAALVLGLLSETGTDGDWLASWPLARDALNRLLVSLAVIFGAVAILRVVDWLVWDRLAPRHAGIRVPRLLRQFVAALVVAFVFLGLLTRVWGVAMPAMLATTGVLGLVLGLALRGILTDFFSGIALNVEQPFRLDDFILLRTRLRGEPITGMVREITWRSTRILTPEDNLVAVPNSVVAQGVVENLSWPSPVSEQEVDIVLDWALPQGVAEALLGAAVTEAWMRGAAAGDKPPTVRISRLDGWGVSWRIIYLLDPRRVQKGPARHELLACVHRHLVVAGLRPVAQSNDRTGPWINGGAHPATGKVPEFDTPDARRRVLDTVSLFDDLSAEERDALASDMTLRLAAAGERVVTRGQPGESMFVVAAGVAEVRVPDTTGGSHLANVLGPGSSFGEMSLLTGAHRSADVVAVSPMVLFEVAGSTLSPLLSARPSLADALSRTVAAHVESDARLSENHVTPAAAPLTLAEQIAASIRSLFGL
jgi:small-conductance mechanosensitive channel/CRP-like cAMP-binding protein